jgi:hypothetical protein
MRNEVTRALGRVRRRTTTRPRAQFAAHFYRLREGTLLSNSVPDSKSFYKFAHLLN